MSGVYEALQRARQGAQGAIPLRPRRKPAPVRAHTAITAPPGPMAGELGTLLAAVRPLLDESHGAVVHIVAAAAGEGTSTIAREFALLAATIGHRQTLLIDANRGQLETARSFGCDTAHGLVELPWTGDDDDEIAHPIAGTLLSVACLIGEQGPARTDAGTVRAIYEELRDRFELIVVDCPAVGGGEYLELAPEASDGVVLVVRAESTRPAVVAHAKGQIEQAGGHLLGAVLNRRSNYIPDFLYRML